jgi:hypothetical protein
MNVILIKELGLTVKETRPEYLCGCMRMGAIMRRRKSGRGWRFERAAYQWAGFWLVYRMRIGEVV